MGETEMKVWKKVEIGGMTGKQLVTLMDEFGVVSGLWVRGMLEDPLFDVSETKVTRFACCEVGDLGLSKRPTMGEIWRRVEKIGSLCPADSAPRIRVDFMEQSNKDRRFIVMKPVATTPVGPSIFYVSRCDNGGKQKKMLLESCFVDKYAHWSLKNKIIFALK